MILFIFTTLITLKLIEVDGYARGAPSDDRICRTMVPKHPAFPQITKSPYKIRVDRDIVHGGDLVHVKVRSSKRGPEFRGMMVMGRDADYEYYTEPVGFFLESEDPNIKMMDCGNIPNSAITHSNSYPKRVLEADWIAPEEPGTYVILGTMMKEGMIFWVRQPSINITVI